MKTYTYSQAQSIFSLADRIYVLHNIVDLEGHTLNMESGCTLTFAGGYFMNGTLNLNETKVYPTYNYLTDVNSLTVTGTPAAATNKLDGQKPYYYDGTEWKAYTDEDVVNYLQVQIDQLKAEDTTVSLSSDKVAVFADNASKTINFTATSTPNPASMVFKEVGSSSTQTASGTTHTFTVNTSSSTQGTKTYQTSFTVAGIDKGTKTATFKFVYQVFTGAGVNYAGTTFTGQTARPNPSGTYSITTANGDHLMFDVPYGMSVSRVLLYDNPNFPTEIAVTPITSTRKGLDNTSYTCYQSVGTFSAGTHTYKVEGSTNF